MEKEYKVKLLKRYNNVNEGTVLYYMKDKKMFGLESKDENISDSIYKSTSSTIMFSESFVRKFIGQLFEDIDGFFVEEEAPIQVKVDNTKKFLDARINELSEQIDTLKKILHARTQR